MKMLRDLNKCWGIQVKIMKRGTQTSICYPKLRTRLDIIRRFNLTLILIVINQSSNNFEKKLYYLIRTLS